MYSESTAIQKVLDKNQAIQLVCGKSVYNVPKTKRLRACCLMPSFYNYDYCIACSNINIIVG